jgi:serine/threonine-protein kinase
VVKRTQSHRSVPAGAVISVSPSVGSAATRGDTVTIIVSTGPRMVGVQDVIGDDADDATDELEDDGFTVAYATTPAAGRSVGRVVSQSPAAGQAPEGSTITLTIGVQVR